MGAGNVAGAIGGLGGAFGGVWAFLLVVLGLAFVVLLATSGRGGGGPRPPPDVHRLRGATLPPHRRS